ncbi:MAG TPA: transcription antitermination factor NusB [Bryobacteraceae bacterium]
MKSRARHRSRQRALQVLFSWDQRRQPVGEAIDSFYGTLASEDAEDGAGPDEFMETLVRGTCENADEIDRRIAEKSEHWRLDRMAAVDRNILRMALFEITKTDTPPAVAIDEALELARQFSGDESVAFVNGVLDAVHRGQPK